MVHRDAHESAKLLATQKGSELNQLNKGRVEMERELTRQAEEGKAATKLSRH